MQKLEVLSTSLVSGHAHTKAGSVLKPKTSGQDMDQTVDDDGKRSAGTMGSVLVIFPYGQLYLPEFDAFGMISSCRTYAVTESMDVIDKISKRIEVIRPSVTIAPFSKVFTYSFSFVRDLQNMISSIRPNAIFTYEAYSTYSYQVSRLSRRFGFRHIVISYETVPASRALWGIFPLTRLIFNSVIRKADFFIALSQRIRNALISSGVDEGTIRTVYPGVYEADEVRHFVDRDGGRKFRLLYMGRLRSNKGISTLLRAFIEFRRTGGSDAELVIAGDGPLEKLVIDIAKTNPGIRYEGFVYGPQKSRLLKEVDVFIYPSEDQKYPFGLKRWEEQTAAAVREAMASGLPVIVSDSGSLPELVGREDVVFRQGDVSQLSEIIKKLYVSQELLQELSVFNLERSRTAFGMDAYAGALESSLEASDR